MKMRPLQARPDLAKAIGLDLKTMTRRPMNPQPTNRKRLKHEGAGPVICSGGNFGHGHDWAIQTDEEPIIYKPINSPYGDSGDRLWLRERARLIEVKNGLPWVSGFDDGRPGASKVRLCYEVDNAVSTWLPYPERLSVLNVGYCVPNGCYREAARTFLEITSVRVERVQDISHEDIQAEGATLFENGPRLCDLFYDIENMHSLDRKEIKQQGKQMFIDLWNKIYGNGAWERNDWVWVYKFMRLEERS